MQDLVVEKTISTPLVRFDAAAGILEIKGESYPENVAKFYSPILDWIKEYLNSCPQEIVMEFDIPYFNSSTSKVLLMILDLLEQGIRDGKKAKVKWLCEEENETAVECGEEFREDLDLLQFDIEPY